MNFQTLTKSIRSRIQNGFLSSFTGDSLALPVHWYYSNSDIEKDFGFLTELKDPKKIHPTSIMGLASSFSAGRKGISGDSNSSVKDAIILKSKRKYWTSLSHYHASLSAGDTTLNLSLHRLLLNSISSHGTYQPQKFLQSFADYMIEDKDKDAYCESYVRGFFENYVQGKDVMKCCAAANHDTASIGAFVQFPTIILDSYFSTSPPPPRSQIEKKVLSHLHLTHASSKKLDTHASVFITMILDTLEMPPSSHRTIAERAAKTLGLPMNKYWGKSSLLPKCTPSELIMDRKVVGSIWSSACYIDDSLPSIIYLLGKYQNGEEALIANANVGGDNCHRGAALGFLLGLGQDSSSFSNRWINGLVDLVGIQKDVNGFLDTLNHRMVKVNGPDV